MRTPRMDQDNSQNMASIGLQPIPQNRSNTQRMRSNSIRDSGSDKETQRSRASSSVRSDKSSEANRYNKARQPINDIVHSALDPIDPNHTAFPPDVLDQLTSQITANVLQQLKATQLSPPTAHTNIADQMETSTSSIDGSPPIDRDKVYTPPSPWRASEEAAQTSPISPRRQSKYSSISDPRRPPSPPFSHEGVSEDSDAKEGRSHRPRGERTSTSGEDCSTILEKIWGDLFDERGRSTTKFSQFLRGTAVHLIEDYEPRHSLVVTPAKMQRYYAETKIGTEIYPWHVIFDDRTSSISRLFRDLEVQHHLIQESPSERPDIPGLTPIGFEVWMTHILKAHPEEEFKRLAYTALHMPVSNPDDRKERFPKELSRRQFPRISDDSVAKKIRDLVSQHCGVRISPRGSISNDDNTPRPSMRAQDTPMQPVQPVQPGMTSQRNSLNDYTLSQTSTRSTLPEIDVNALRQTVSEVPGENVLAASPIEIVPPPTIERERKPYVAQPGGGKLHDLFQNQAASGPESTPVMAPPPTKMTRSASVNNGRPSDSRFRPVQPIAIHQSTSHGPPSAMDNIPAMRPRTGSTYHKDPPRRSDRNRSPSSSRIYDPPYRQDDSIPYGTHHASFSGDYAPTSWKPDNRYSQRASFSSDPRERDRDRDRDSRQKYYPASGGDGHRYYPKEMPNDEEYSRSSNPGYMRPDGGYPPAQQCPPNSYKGRA